MHAYNIYIIVALGAISSTKLFRRCVRTLLRGPFAPPMPVSMCQGYMKSVPRA